MTTVAEVDVKINAKLDSFLQSSKKAEKIISDLDKRLNKISNKKVTATVSTKVGSTKDLALLERRLNVLNNKKFNATVTPKVGSTADLARLEARLNKLGAKTSNVKVAASSSTALSSVGGGISSLGGVVAGVGAALGVDQIKDYADAWTEAGNELRAASEIAGVQTRSLEELNNLAADTRSGLTETVDLYSKLVRSASGVAKSENEIAIATATVNKAFKAGGATMQEQISGITQLGQALGSGVLQGDELRSLRENAPIIAQAIANEFDTTIAGIKKLGEEGKLTSDRVFKAIVDAADEVNAAFSKTNATIGDSFQQLQNRLTEYIGHMDQTYGITQTVNSILGALTNNIESVANAAAAAGVVLLAAFGGSAVLALANPWVLLAAAIGTAAYAISELWDNIVPLEGSFATLGDYANVAWSAIKDGATSVSESVVAAFTYLLDSLSGFFTGIPESAGEAMNMMTEIFSSAINFQIQNWVNMKDTVALVFTSLPNAVADGVMGAMNAMIAGVESGINAVIGAVNSAIVAINGLSGVAGISPIEKRFANVDLGRIITDVEGSAKEFGTQFADIWSRSANPKDFVGGFIASADAGVKELTNRANALAEARREAQKAGAFGGVTPISGAGSTAGYGGGIAGADSDGGGKKKKKKENAYEKEIQQIKDKTAALVAETEAQSKLNPLIEDYEYTITRAKSAQELINAAQKAGVAGANELVDVQKILNGELSGLSPKAQELAGSIVSLATKYGEAVAASKKLAESQQHAKQAMDETKQFGKDVLGGFISDLKEGKSATEALANALSKVADKLLDVGLNMLFDTGNFKNGGGSGFGNIFGSLFSGLFGGFRADGGSVSSSKGYVVGENGPEWFQPDTAGSIIPNDKLTAVNVPQGQLKPSVGGRSGPTSVQIELVTNTDTGVITEIANTQIRSAAPTIVKTSVQQSQKETKKNLGNYLTNTQMREM